MERDMERGTLPLFVEGVKKKSRCVERWFSDTPYNLWVEFAPEFFSENLGFYIAVNA